MKKIVLIPDSFKGTMSSIEICGIMEHEIRLSYPQAEVISIPVADGGEGTVDCFLEALKGEKVFITAKNPFMEDIQGFYGLVDKGKTAVIEMAACAGLPLVENRKNPMKATTYGVGQLILDAANKGARNIIVGLGGSATNDGGCGAAVAAGVRFYNKDGCEFIPAGGTLVDIAHIDTSGYDKSLHGIKIITMCDINNPMYGEQGAAYVFGPQKGANPEQVELLDEGVKHLAKIIMHDLKKDLATIPGAGAAGAMGAGMMAFFDSALQMGIDTILDVVRFDELARNANLVLTGEGRIDGQSLHGKAVIGVAQRAKKYNVPVVAIVGDIGDSIEPAYETGVSAIFSINRVAVDFKYAQKRAKSDMALTIGNLMRFMKSLGIV